MAAPVFVFEDSLEMFGGVADSDDFYVVGVVCGAAEEERCDDAVIRDIEADELPTWRVAGNGGGDIEIVVFDIAGVEDALRIAVGLIAADEVHLHGRGFGGFRSYLVFVAVVMEGKGFLRLDIVGDLGAEGQDFPEDVVGDRLVRRCLLWVCLVLAHNNLQF